MIPAAGGSSSQIIQNNHNSQTNGTSFQANLTEKNLKLTTRIKKHKVKKYVRKVKPLENNAQIGQGRFPSPTLQKMLPYEQRKQQFMNNLRPNTALVAKNYLSSSYSIDTFSQSINNSQSNRTLPSLDMGNVTITSTNRYFGDDAKSLYYDTYRQLKGRGEVLLGGYNELEVVIGQENEHNLFDLSMNEMKSIGVITPRDKYNSLKSSMKQSNNINTHFDDNEGFTNFITSYRPSSSPSMMRSATENGSNSNNNNNKTVKIPQRRSLDGLIDEMVIPNDINLNNDSSFDYDGFDLNSLSIESNSLLMEPILTDSNEILLPINQSSSFDSFGTFNASTINTDTIFGLNQQQDMLIFESTASFPLENADLNATYTVNSPRAVFLTGCLKRGLPPVTSALLRRRITSKINLSHMTIGNDYAQILATCIADLPYLEQLILSDNNLNDEGITPIVNAISLRNDLELLDLSENKIGLSAASALRDFVGHQNCKLKVLRLSGADIDDQECALLVKELQYNSILKELDLSKNLIGKDENRNVVQPSFFTGAEALAKLLNNKTCQLEVLQLHWNMIRLESAVTLCHSLRHNDRLNHLDISYNSLGRKAADVLGAAIIQNKALKFLNIAHNGIDAAGCFTLLVGIRENKSIQTFIIDGNPMGEEGARMLVRLAKSDGSRLKISAKVCDFTVKSNSVKNLNAPGGEHRLNLSLPYERAVFLELLSIAAANPALEFTHFQYQDQHDHSKARPITPKKAQESKTPRGNSHAVGLVRYSQAVEELSRDEEIEKFQSEAMSKLLGISCKYIIDKIMDFDVKGFRSFQTKQLKQVMSRLGIDNVPELIGSIRWALDPFDAGYIQFDEFASFIKQRGIISKHRIHEIMHTHFIGLSNEPNKRYVPPTKGIVTISIVEKLVLEGGKFPLSRHQCNQIIHVAENSSNPLPLLIYALESFSLYLEEAKQIYSILSNKCDDFVLLQSKVVQAVYSTSDAILFIKAYASNDLLKLKRLKQKLGNSYYTFLGIYSGFYSLDLSQDTDRVCMKRLIEQSIRVENSRKMSGKWDTSQNGNWNCFRNEIHYPVGNETPAELLERSISPKYFYPLPNKGRLEFDFINSCRPSKDMLADIRAIDNDQLIDLLLITRLIDDSDQQDRVLHKINELSLAQRRSFLSNGSPYWKTELGRGQVVADNLYSMYCTLHERKESLKKATRREQARVNDVNTGNKGGNKRRPKSFFTKKGSHMFSVDSSSIDAGDEEIMEESFANIVELLVDKEKSKELTIQFRSASNIESKLFLQKANWIKRLHDVMLESNGSDEMKSAAILEFFETELMNVWIYCKQLSVLLESFSIGSVSKSHIGSYRVELIVTVFDHIIDLHNFELIIMILSAEEQASIYCRIGMLNVFNPCKPEGTWVLDLVRWEERQMAKMLIHLNLVEVGENWINRGFIYDHGFHSIQGWDLTVAWFEESNMPKKGILTVDYYSGDGMNLAGNYINRRLRNILTSLVLVEQRDLIAEAMSGRKFRIINYNTELSQSLDFDQSASDTNTSLDLSLGPALNVIVPLLPVDAGHKLAAQVKMLDQFSHAHYDNNNRNEQNSFDNNSYYRAEDANNHISSETELKWNYT
eukprot:gene9185-12389_t